MKCDYNVTETKTFRSCDNQSKRKKSEFKKKTDLNLDEESNKIVLCNVNHIIIFKDLRHRLALA